MPPPDPHIGTDEHFRAEIGKAVKALDHALESFPAQVQQKLQPAEVAVVAVRDDLIERARHASDPAEQSNVQECLKKANVCVSLVVGMEYPQGGVQQEPLQQARSLLQELARCHPARTPSADEPTSLAGQPITAKGDSMNRRTLLIGLIAVGNLSMAAVLGIPAALAALSPALRSRRTANWLPVGPLDEFPVGDVVQATVPVDQGQWTAAFAEKAVYVWRRDETKTVVFSRNCTDLSCPVNYDPGSACFFCPCHGGIFAQDGTPMAGPPSEPLYRYANRVEQGILEIDIHSVPPMN